MMRMPRFLTKPNKLVLAASILAAVLCSTSVAQPPDEGGRRGGFGGRDGGPGQGGFGGRRGGPDGGPGQGGFGGRGRGGPGGGFGGPGGGPPPEMMMRMIPVLAALDADKDGTISKSEIENASAALKKLDKDNDGELSGEEMAPDFSAMRGRGGRGGFGGGPGGDRGPGGPGGDRGPGGFGDRPGGDRGGPGGSDMVDRLMAMDKNSDGKLTKDELPERVQRMVERADKDGDGAVSKEEIQAMAKERMGGGGGFGRGRGGPGGPGGGRPDAAGGRTTAKTTRGVIDAFDFSLCR